MRGSWEVRSKMETGIRYVMPCRICYLGEFKVKSQIYFISNSVPLQVSSDVGAVFSSSFPLVVAFYIVLIKIFIDFEPPDRLVDQTNGPEKSKGNEVNESCLENVLCVPSARPQEIDNPLY